MALRFRTQDHYDLLSHLRAVTLAVEAALPLRNLS